MVEARNKMRLALNIHTLYTHTHTHTLVWCCCCRSTEHKHSKNRCHLSFFVSSHSFRFFFSWCASNIFSFDSSYKKPLVLALGDCIPVRPWSDSPIACIAELRMVWRDKNEQCLLASLRLYFLPENTPMGRNCHGEVSDEFFPLCS